VFNLRPMHWNSLGRALLSVALPPPFEKANTAKSHYCDGSVVVGRESRTGQALVHVACS
jgi:hypothetical protein